MRHALLWIVLVTAIGWIVVGPAGAMLSPRGDHQAIAQDKTGAAPADPEPGSAAPKSPESFWDILRAGGVIGLLIIILSIGTVAMVIENAMTIRAPVLMPPGLGERVRDLVGAGQLGPAHEVCRQQPSFLAYVLQAAIAEYDGGWSAVEKAMEDASAEQSARLFRKVEHLSVIGNIAPMLGLLGTVIGMILAFREVADTQGAARAADLARGIYQALVTTVEGLIVAIPSLAAFAYFRSRVDQLVAEASYLAQHVMRPLKSRRRPAPRPQSPAPPPVRGEA